MSEEFIKNYDVMVKFRVQALSKDQANNIVKLELATTDIFKKWYNTSGDVGIENFGVVEITV